MVVVIPRGREQSLGPRRHAGARARVQGRSKSRGTEALKSHGESDPWKKLSYPLSQWLESCGIEGSHTRLNVDPERTRIRAGHTNIEIQTLQGGGMGLTCLDSQRNIGWNKRLWQSGECGPTNMSCWWRGVTGAYGAQCSALAKAKSVTGGRRRWRHPSACCQVGRRPTIGSKPRRWPVEAPYLILVRDSSSRGREKKPWSE